MTCVRVLFLVLLGILGSCVTQDNNLECPSQENILPCRCTTRNDEYQLWCSHSDLPRVLMALRTTGKNIYQSIDELILENNNLPSLSGKTFFPLKAVRLMLRYNGLERVSSSWLSGLEQTLMELYIVEPELKSLPEDSLNRLHALEAVTIQSAMLKRLPSFSNLPKLIYVQIESLSLMELTPSYFKNIPRLEKIHIYGSPLLNRLDMDLFQDLPSLKLLNISYSGLSLIHPRSINTLPSLKELSLIGNKIIDVGVLGRTIRDLPNLESLHLDYNMVEIIDEESFIDLPALKIVSISYNRIMEIRGGAFHRLPSLKTINLNHNMIKYVHPESFSLIPLEELQLVDNEINHASELRAILSALPRLISLDLSYNNLEIIPFGLVRSHTTLERLSLDFNKIDLIERDALTEMPALRELSLKNNSMSDNLRMPIWNLPNLKGLDVSANFFKRIEPGFLTNLPSLRRVDFSANQIDYINPLALLDTPALEYVNLSYNSLVNVHPATFRHLIGLYELDLSNNRLLQFVPGLPRNIEYIHLQRNNIANFPSTSSPDLDLPTLRMLDISSNSLKAIKSNSLRTLPLLKKLYLGDNFLQNLEDRAFDGLVNLEALDVQGNNLLLIPPQLLNELEKLETLILRNNKLNMIRNRLFQYNNQLKVLDVSKNQLRDIHYDAFETTRKLEVINASYNYLISLPSSINELKSLKIMDLTSNRLTEISPDLLSSLKSLTELRMSENFLQELPTATFDNMEHLKILYVNNNELSNVETNALKALPALKHVKLNENKIRSLQDYVFNDIPNLQILELQDNLIEQISSEAFYLVPQLLMLNLSGNLITDMNQAGLQNLKSLEMLDVSYNRLADVQGSDLEKMEWLVELKMDNNAICGIRGVSFNKMPRLRVLSIKNNKMMSFPERAVQKLRGNLAVLDIDGNPLACTCSLLWLRAWLQESSLKGPKCLDGALLTEKRISREDCMQESRLLDPVAPGCESELLSVPNLYDSHNTYITPWMNLKSNSSTKTSLPSPEESELFYDDYLDYQYNDTESSNSLSQGLGHRSTTEKSANSEIGNTPTFYAGTPKRNKTNTPKPVNGSPSTSGFTIFGVPLTSFSFNNLWNNGRGEKKDDNGAIVKASLTTKPIKINEFNTTKTRRKDVKMVEQTAERKIAIMNKPVRGTSARGMFPISNPQVETGGFVPLLPGSGGFTPISNPYVRPITEVEIEKANVKLLNITETKNIKSTTSLPKYTQSYLENRTSSMGHPLPFPITTFPSTTAMPPKKKIETKLFVQPTLATIKKGEISFSSLEKILSEQGVNETSLRNANLKPREIEQIKNISEFLSTTTPTNFKRNATYPDIEILEDGRNFDDIFKEVVENVSLPLNFNETSTESISKIYLTTQNTSSSNNFLNSTQTNKNITMKPALLIPGGEQPQFRSAGRSTITKIASPHISSSSPLLSVLKESEEITPLPHNRQENVVNREDKSWYFANYNSSNNLGSFRSNNGYYQNFSSVEKLNLKLIILLYLITFYLV